MRKKLSHEISISEMLTMRQEGLTNKQIADRLDIAVSTVYQYIGKRSAAVMNAAVQGKPCPVTFSPPNNDSAPETRQKEDSHVKDDVQQSQLPTSMLVLKETHSYDLQGIACVFRVDTGTRTVEMRDDNSGTVSGMVDARDLPAFIRELQEVLKILKED